MLRDNESITIEDRMQTNGLNSCSCKSLFTSHFFTAHILKFHPFDSIMLAWDPMLSLVLEPILMIFTVILWSAKKHILGLLLLVASNN